MELITHPGESDGFPGITARGSEVVGATNGILARYASVLDAVAARPDGLSLTETVQATGLPRGTVHRLLGTLQAVGYLATRDGRKIYVLGPRLKRLAHAGASHRSIAETVRPVLDGLVDKIGETAFFARLAGDRVESCAIATPSREEQSHVQPGRDMPVHAAASAKAIFAYQEPALVSRALVRPRTRYTKNTRVAAAEVREDLAAVRRAGFAVCDNELDPGVLSYAVPVHLDGAGVLYSVGVVGLSARLGGVDEATVVEALQEAAASTAARLSRG